MAEITAALTLDAGPAKATTDNLGASALKAAQSVDTLSASQRELIAKSEKVAALANNIDIQNKKAVQSYLQQVAQVRALAQQIGILNEVEQRTAQAAQEVTQHVVAEANALRALKVETGLASAAQVELGAATGLTKGGLNSLRASVQSFAASMLGAAPGVTQFTGALGTMALGSGVMIGVLAALAAASFAWDKLTESVRKSKEEHEKALKVLADLRRERDEGPAGSVGASLPAGHEDLQKDLDKIARLQTTIANLRASANQGAVVAVRQQLEQELDATRQHYRALLGDVQAGEAKKHELEKAAADQTAQQNASALEARLSFNEKDAAARRAALTLLAKDQKDYADLLKKPFTADNSKEIARLASEMKGLNDALHPKATASGDAKESRELAEAMREAERAIDAFNKAREQQTEHANAAIEQGKIDIDATRRMIEAYREGPAAVQALTDQLEIEAATRDFLAKSQQMDADERQKDLQIIQDEIRERQRLSHVLTDEKDARDQTAQAQKRAEDDARREQERRTRQIQRATAGAIEQAITDVSNGQNPARAFGNMLKQAAIRALSEALAERFLASKFAALLGIGAEGAAKKQDGAALKMVDAAKLQNDAADKMLRASGQAPGGATTPPTTNGNAQQAPAWLTNLKTVGEFAAVAYGGYKAGEQTGEATYSQNRGKVANYAIGAIGGALSGAATGAALGSVFGPVGTVVGGAIGAVTGFVGGILGVHKASKEAAKATEELRKQLELNLDAMRAQVNHDDLSAAIAQGKAQFDALRKQTEDAYAYGDRNSATVRERNKRLADITALEEKYNAQLKEEAAAKSRYFSEDLDVEQERARATIAESQGNTAEAKRLRDDADRRAYNEEQERRLDDYRRTHDMGDAANQAQYAQLQSTVALNEQAFALQQNTKALTDLTTTLHNAPTGYKYQRDVYDFSVPKPPTFPAPVNPFRPPTTPLASPQLSRESTGTRNTFTGDIIVKIDGAKSPEETANSVALVFKRMKNSSLGKDATGSAFMDELLA